MRVVVTPERVKVTPGSPVIVTITVTNTEDVIGGHLIRVLGVDPRWVSVSQERLSLFPGGTGVTNVTLNLPTGLPAGLRRLSIQVRELTPPESAVVVDVDLELPQVRRIDARIEPATVTAGRRASFGMVVENNGNMTWAGSPVGSDEEDKVAFRFTPSDLTLQPGEHAAVEVAAKARRRLFGKIVVRPLGVKLTEHDAPPAKEKSDQPDARGTFVQRPVLGRGGLALLGLLAAVTVFALVITYALSGVVGRSAADRDLALQVAAADQNAANATGTATLAGSVRLLTSNSPVPGVTVDVFTAADTANPVTSLATNKSGAFSFPGLAAGSYKLQFRGAGFAELWYPDALDDSDATTINVGAGQTKSGLNVAVGGLPASIAGTVLGSTPAGATVSLMLPGTAVDSGVTGVTGQVASSDTETPAAKSAVIETVKAGTDGSFELANVPSPGTYDLAVSQTGYATQVERLDVGGGEQRTGLQIRLRQGDGLIAGTVSDKSGPVGGASITAEYGESTVQTVSLTTGKNAGSFILRGLPTPSNVTVTISKLGYRSQTLSLALATSQHLSGVGVTLGGTSGSMGGTVSTPTGVDPGGVSVTVTNGTFSVTTVTDSAGGGKDAGTPGHWHVTGLPVPSTYTVTFSRTDLSSQSFSVSLNRYGDATGSGSFASADGVSPHLTSATVDLTGITCRANTATADTCSTETCISNKTGCRVGEVVITLTGGTQQYQVTSASLPATQTGTFSIDNLPPGTYTLTTSALGTEPSSKILDVTAGSPPKPQTLYVPAAASISGTVYSGGTPQAGAEVRLYLASDYPNVSLQTVRTNRHGFYAFDAIDAPQTYVVEYNAAGGTTPQSSKSFTLKPSQQRTLNFGQASGSSQ